MSVASLYPVLPPNIMPKCNLWSQVDVWPVLRLRTMSRSKVILQPGSVLMWPVLTMDSFWTSMVYVAVWSYVDVGGPIAAGGYVHGLCCYQKPWGSSMIQAPDDCKEQGIWQWHYVSPQLRRRDMEDFCNNLYPHPKPDTLQKINSLKRKPSKKTLENCD